MSRYVVDTHALIWFLGNSPRLGKDAKIALDDPESELILPAIALAEALWILSSRDLGVQPAQLLEAIENDLRFHVYPLTKEIVRAAQNLTSISEMHDRQIAATALLLSKEGREYALLTRDGSITQSGTVRTVW